MKTSELFNLNHCVIISFMKNKHMILITIILIFDQMTKLLISSNMNLYDSIPVIENFFSITYVQNTGAAWSMLEGNMMFFYFITFIAIFLMMKFYKSSDCDEISAWGIAMMLGGTIGNFVDRIRLQYVVDFLDFNIFGYDFPVFNVADIALCIGVAVVVLSVLLEGGKNEA